MSPLKKKTKNPTLKHLFLLCFLAVIAWAINFYFHPDTSASNDAALYADTARSIVKGYNFVIPVTFPHFLSYSIPSLPLGWPSFYPHLYPLAAAFSFLIFGVRDFSLALASGFFFVLTIPFLYFLAERLFNEQVAFLASLWYIFTPSLLDYSAWGGAESLFTFLIVLLFFLIIFSQNTFFWAGLVLGLAYLTKHQGILLLPPLLLYILKVGKKPSRLLTFLVGFILILFLKKLFLPPLVTDYGGIRNNTFWTTVAYEALFPANQAGRSLIQTTASQVFLNFNLIIKKIFTNLYYFLQKGFNLTLPSITVLFILSFFRPALNQKSKYFKLFFLITLLIFILFHLTTFFAFRYFHPLLPLLIVYAADSFLSFLKKFNPKKMLLLTTIFTFFFVIVPCFTSPFWGSSIQQRLTKPQRPTIQTIVGNFIKENTPSDSIIVSNYTTAVSWQGERKVIFLPISLAELKKIDQEIIPVNFLLLVKFYDWQPFEPEWEDLMTNPRDFANFHLIKTINIKPENNYHGMKVRIVLFRKDKQER